MPLAGRARRRRRSGNGGLCRDSARTLGRRSHRSAFQRRSLGQAAAQDDRAKPARARFHHQLGAMQSARRPWAQSRSACGRNRQLPRLSGGRISPRPPARYRRPRRGGLARIGGRQNTLQPLPPTGATTGRGVRLPDVPSGLRRPWRPLGAGIRPRFRASGATRKPIRYTHTHGAQTPAWPEGRFFHTYPAAIGVSDNLGVSTTREFSRSLGAPPGGVVEATGLLRLTRVCGISRAMFKSRLAPSRKGRGSESAPQCARAGEP